jgi:hypothetical protein
MASPLLFHESFLDIILDEETPCLHLDWKGYQTDASIKTGCEQLLVFMKAHQTYKILNDNTHALGIWISVTKWLVFDFRPRAMEAGLQCCAHVYGPSRLAQISAEAARMLLEPFTEEIKGFTNIADAKAWLRNYA